MKASACTECGACMERCPFGVDAIAKMRQAVEWFE
jgi:predicted aldo/keto reductase-like oxidoreductase